MVDVKAEELQDDPDIWIVWYADTEMPIEIFSGCDATGAARRRFDQMRCAWTCALFKLVERG